MDDACKGHGCVTGAWRGTARGVLAGLPEHQGEGLWKPCNVCFFSLCLWEGAARYPSSRTPCKPPCLLPVSLGTRGRKQVWDQGQEGSSGASAGSRDSSSSGLRVPEPTTQHTAGVLPPGGARSQPEGRSLRASPCGPAKPPDGPEPLRARPGCRGGSGPPDGPSRRGGGLLPGQQGKGDSTTLLSCREAQQLGRAARLR